MSTDNVIAAFSEEDVERLTGVSIRQLRYWDSTGFFKPRLADENRRWAHSRVYDFRDVVCLKVLNIIRNQEGVPLPRLREAKEKLSHLGDDVWARVQLFILNRRVVVYNPEIDQKRMSSRGRSFWRYRFQSSVAIWKRLFKPSDRVMRRLWDESASVVTRPQINL